MYMLTSSIWMFFFMCWSVCFLLPASYLVILIFLSWMPKHQQFHILWIKSMPGVRVRAWVCVGVRVCACACMCCLSIFGMSFWCWMECFMLLTSSIWMFFLNVLIRMFSFASSLFGYFNFLIMNTETWRDFVLSKSPCAKPNYQENTRKHSKTLENKTF